MGTSPELLRIQGLTKEFPNNGAPRVVLQGVDLNLPIHDSIAVVGPSGCGKTTMLLIIAGLLPPTYGSIILEGEPCLNPSRKIAVVLQEYGLFPWKTAIENILLGARMRKIKVSPEAVMALQRELGIEGLDHLYPLVFNTIAL